MWRLILFLLPAIALAQISGRHTAGTTGSSITYQLLATGVNSHRIDFYPLGTVSACTVKLEQSADGAAWSDLIAGQSCLSVGSASGSGQVSYVRITVSAFTGSGTVTVGYAGSIGGAAAAGDGAIQDGVSSAIKATVFDFTNSNPLAVRLTDTNGDYVSAGGGTEYTEDAASPANPVAATLSLRRRDTPATETTTDGDWTTANSTSKGELYVKHIDSIPVTDNAGSLTVDAPIGTPVNVQVGDGTRTATIRDTGASDSVNVAIVDASGNQITSFGGGTEYTEDTATPANPVGATISARRRDTLTAETDVDADWVTINSTNKGELYVKHVDPIPASQSGTWNINNISGTVSLPTGASTLAEQQTQTTALQLIDDTVATTAAAIPGKGLAISGTDGTNARIIKLDTAGEAQVDVLTMPAIVGAKSNNGGAPGGTNLGTLPAVATAANPTYTEGNQVGLSTFLDGAVRTRVPDFSTSGSITANGQSVTLSGLNGSSSWAVDITGTWVGTIATEVSVDGSAFTGAVGITTGGTIVVGSTGSNAMILFPAGSYASIRVRSTAWTSGTANIQLRASAGVNGVMGTYGLVSGLLSNNSGAPGTNHIAVLPSRATASAPSYTEGNAVLDSVDLSGRKRVTLETALPSGSNNIGAVNVNQIDGSAIATTGTGIQKVGISDNAGTTLIPSSDGMNSTGSGLLAVGLTGQYDTAPTTLTDGRFGHVRISQNSNLYATLRDAAGNERGQNINASNQALVETFQTTATNLNAQVVGDVAHDGTDAGKPVKVGMRALAHGTNPTAVAAADRTDWLANRHGVPWIIGGHPNVKAREFLWTTSKTDIAIVSVTGGLKIVVTALKYTCDKANTVDVAVRIGFGATTLPTLPTDGNTADGILESHPGTAAGSGLVDGTGAGILGVGADGEDLRITAEAPTSGACRAIVRWYEIES